jgi:hypothetical protein
LLYFVENPVKYFSNSICQKIHWKEGHKEECSQLVSEMKQPTISRTTALDDDMCSICLDKPKDIVRLDCKHVFCAKCILDWQEKGTSGGCPMCRHPFPSDVEDLLEAASLNMAPYTGVKLGQYTEYQGKCACCKQNFIDDDGQVLAYRKLNGKLVFTGFLCREKQFSDENLNLGWYWIDKDKANPINPPKPLTRMPDNFYLEEMSQYDDFGTYVKERRKAKNLAKKSRDIITYAQQNVGSKSNRAKYFTRAASMLQKTIEVENSIQCDYKENCLPLYYAFLEHTLNLIHDSAGAEAAHQQSRKYGQ